MTINLKFLTIMKKVIIMVQDTDEYNERLSNEYQNHLGTLDEFVDIIRKGYPQAVCAEPIEEEVQGDIMEESDRYMMTEESHNMGETMRIYEK